MSAAGVVRAPGGLEMPRLGQGTWEMGADARRRAGEVAALRLGLDLGMTLVDTAEMYADGGAEEVVAEAIARRRDEVFLVTKVLPDNATRAGTLRAAEGSLRRLRTDRIDLYLLHWPGGHPLAETVAAFEALARDGKIRAWGLSNFDLDEMQEAGVGKPGDRIACNQILYNLRRRGPERRLIPWCRERGIAVVAYSPLEQGKLLRGAALETVAARHGVTPPTVAVAWTLRQEGIVSIPKAASEAHVRQNAAAAGLRLSADDLAVLDAAYPRPERDCPLETL